MQLCYQSNSGTKKPRYIVDTKSETKCFLRRIRKGIFAGAYSSNHNSLELKISIVHLTAQIEGQMLQGGTVTQLRGKYCSSCSYGRNSKLKYIWSGYVESTQTTPSLTPRVPDKSIG